MNSANEIVLFFRDSDDFDLTMKGSIEDTIIQWSSLIYKVLQEDPSAAFSNSQHPTPQAGKLVSKDDSLSIYEL